MYLSNLIPTIPGGPGLQEMFKNYTFFDPSNGGFQSLDQLTGQVGELWLIAGTLLALILSLVCCFYGYRMSRIIMSLSGFVTGSYLGNVLISPIFHLQGPLAVIIPGLCGMLLASLAWLIYRVGLCLLAFFLTYSASQILLPFGGFPKIAICIFLGAAAAVVVLSLLRPGIILITAAFGGVHASAGVLTAADYFRIALPPFLSGILPLSVGFVAAGIIVQLFLSRKER